MNRRDKQLITRIIFFASALLAVATALYMSEASIETIPLYLNITYIVYTLLRYRHFEYLFWTSFGFKSMSIPACWLYLMTFYILPLYITYQTCLHKLVLASCFAGLYPALIILTG